MPIGTIQQSDNLNTQTAVLINSSVVVTSVVKWEMKITPPTQLVEFSLKTVMSACVIECRSIGSCNSRGLCTGLLITGLCFLLTTSLWNKIPVQGYQFPRTCALIQIKYVLPKPCHLPQYSYRSRDPTTHPVTWLRLAPGFRDLYSYWGRWHSKATHT